MINVMTIMEQPDNSLEGFLYLERDLAKLNLRSDEAQALEAEQRMSTLQAMVDSDEWEVDAAGNVISTSLTDEEKGAMLACGRFCIIGVAPQVQPLHEDTKLSWKAAGLIFYKELTINSDYPGEVTLTLECS